MGLASLRVPLLTSPGRPRVRGELALVRPWALFGPGMDSGGCSFIFDSWIRQRLSFKAGSALRE